jgi:hypothetical protein
MADLAPKSSSPSIFTPSSIDCWHRLSVAVKANVEVKTGAKVKTKIIRDLLRLLELENYEHTILAGGLPEGTRVRRSE